MIVTVLLAAGSFAAPPLFTALLRRAHGLPLACPGFYALWAFGAAGGVLGALLGGAWPNGAASGASGLVALVLWWHSRRKRKRVLRALGVKAKARVAAMLRKMPKPSPGLVPQGVRG